MGHATFTEMLDQLIRDRDDYQADFRADGVRAHDRLDRMERLMQTLLEKLRDMHDPN